MTYPIRASRYPAVLECVDWDGVVAAIRLYEAEQKREQREWEREKKDAAQG